MKLVIGNKNYSSWSLRPWLLLDAFGVEFKEVLESLAQPNLRERLLQYSETARVPVLVDGDLTIWDSLAICEHINESHLSNLAWPQSLEERSLARAVTAEMHSGFNALRNELPMNCRSLRCVELSDECQLDISRIDRIWSSYARSNANGDLRLFGEFGVADSFFAPVVMRFHCYGIALTVNARAYCDSMLAHPSLIKWVAQAKQETEIVAVDEAGVERG